MEVRMMIGRYAGDVRDVEPEAARALIAAGSAADPRFEEPEAELALALAGSFKAANKALRVEKALAKKGSR